MKTWTNFLRSALSLGLIASGSLVALAQSATHDHQRCGQQHALEQLYERSPETRASVQAAEQAVQDYVRQNAGNLRVQEDIIYIPVVVHVVWKSAIQNLSDAQIQSQIDVLNEDYAMTNLDRASLRSSFNSIAANTQIQFCLAETDPDGNFTTGIIRKQTGKASFNDTDTAGWDGVKESAYGGSDAWPRSQYLNMWVCNLDPTSGVLGYAYPPGVAGALDGVVMNYRYFGREGVVIPPYNLGRTTTHEVGHWLGLRHIWGDGGCGVDDGISDTPTASGPYFGCPSPTATTCGSLDLWENYMDYTDDRCMVMFTEGQGVAMRNVLNTVRSSIPVSPKCYFNTGVEEPALAVGNGLQLFPNPVTGNVIQLVLEQAAATEGMLQIFDATGRQVWSQVQPAGWQQVSLLLPELPNGFYLLQWSGMNSEITQRFVISK
ncbi:MAG: T9SS type A sorting domain-containing protein [Bacteroidetes bacterium]|nr:T9SS type A sorting domain-containing protein [Bacteroidota bacterium]